MSLILVAFILIAILALIGPGPIVQGSPWINFLVVVVCLVIIVMQFVRG